MRPSVTGTVVVPIFSRKRLPASAAVSSIQTRSAAKRRVTVGRRRGSASTSPRMTSISSVRVKVTERPATATARSPSKLTIRATELGRPDAATTMRSPTATRPEATVPVKPRKSPFGRLTHCTGKRSGAPSASRPVSTASRWASRAGPPYQGVRALRLATLSPSRADIGIATTEWKASGAAKLAKAASISRKRASEKSTRSILFTASTTWRMPSRETMAAWRRVCSSRPLRASTSSTASSALEAPVAMLRVYWRWPGVSATTKARRGVAKKR